MTEFVGKEVLVGNKPMVIKNIRKTSDGMVLAYFENNLVFNIEVLRDLKGNYLVP